MREMKPLASVVDEIVTHRRSDNIVRRKRIDARQEHAESLAEVRFPSKLVRIARPPVSHLLIENSPAHRCCGSLVLPFVLRICILSGVKGDIVSVRPVAYRHVGVAGKDSGDCGAVLIEVL